MTTTDPFSSDAWRLVEMTNAINTMPFVPGRIGALGLFNSRGVTTTTINIEMKRGVLALLPTKERGDAPSQGTTGRANKRPFNIPHIPHADTVMASEVQNVRTFGGTDLQGVEAKRDEKLGNMARKHDVTLEYHRLGAVKGTILDADGTVIYNLFDEFNVTQTSVDFTLGTSGTDIKDKCLDVIRAIEAALDMAPYGHIHAVCGQDFFDALTSHPAVVEAYKRWQDGEFLRSDQRKGFPFCGIVFEEYVGGVGSTQFVAASEAHFFPVGVPELFETYFAPGDFLETVNTVGLPRYARSEMMEFNRGMKILTESNPLNICTRPKVLVKGTTSN